MLNNPNTTTKNLYRFKSPNWIYRWVENRKQQSPTQIPFGNDNQKYSPTSMLYTITESAINRL